MVQLPNIVCMFAVSQTKRFTYIIFAVGYFYILRGSFISKNIRLSNPCIPLQFICGGLLVEMGGDSLSFIYSFQISKILMTKRDEICDARNNSTLKATCAHDTGKLPICGNPYLDLAQHGFDLHSCDVRFLKKPNANGHTVTGVFNVSGKWHTAASHNYEGLIQYLLTILYRRRDYIADRQKAKRDAKRK